MVVPRAHSTDAHELTASLDISRMVCVTSREGNSESGSSLLAGADVLVEERGELAPPEVAEAEVVGPRDDTRVLGDDAGVEFPREEEEVEVLPGVDDALSKGGAVLVAEVGDDAVDRGPSPLVGGVARRLFGPADGFLRDPKPAVDPVFEFVDEPVDEFGGDDEFEAGGALSDDPRVQLRTRRLGDVARGEHRRQLVGDRGRRVTGDVVAELRGRDTVEQPRESRIEVFAVATNLVGEEQRGVEDEPLFERTLRHTDGTRTGGQSPSRSPGVCGLATGR